MQKEVRVDDVRVGTRYRKEMGDLHELAKSIHKLGLLHPPVVTSTMQLLCGARRLAAVKLLGKETIAVRVLDIEDWLQVEHDENECRKEFTKSERVAICEAIRQEIGNRRGERTDTAGGIIVKSSKSCQLPADLPEVEPGKETRDMAAKKAGFSSTTDYRNTATVVTKGVQELVEKMDADEISVSAAAEVARMPAPQQREFLAKNEKITQRQARAAVAEPAIAPTEPTLRTPEAMLAEAQAAAKLLRRLIAELESQKELASELANGPLAKHFDYHELLHHVGRAISIYKRTIPHAVCPHCGGRGGWECGA